MDVEKISSWPTDQVNELGLKKPKRVIGLLLFVGSTCLASPRLAGSIGFSPSRWSQIGCASFGMVIGIGLMKVQAKSDKWATIAAGTFVGAFIGAMSAAWLIPRFDFQAQPISPAEFALGMTLIGGVLHGFGVHALFSLKKANRNEI